MLLPASLIVKIVIVLGALIAGYVSVLVTRDKDNPIEQAAEEVIKEETGISVDLTPDKASPDNTSTS